MNANLEGSEVSWQKKAKLSFIKMLFRFEEFGVFSALVILVVLLGLSTDVFLKPSNLLEISRQTSYMGIMALGAVFVIASGNIDLSVGAIYMLSPIITGLMLQSGHQPWFAVLAGLVTGIFCGAINGSLHIFLRIPMMVISLGTTTIYRSVGLVLSKGFPIHKFKKEGFFFETLGDMLGPIPTSALVWLLLVVILSILFKNTPFGNHVRGIGSNMQAALFSGINIAKVKFFVMVLQGFLCAVAGILSTLFLKVADPMAGNGFELYVIAAAIIGGTSLEGGSGSILGAVIGAFLITVIRSGIVLLGVHYYWTGIVTGSMIIGAVFLDYFVRRKRAK